MKSKMPATNPSSGSSGLAAAATTHARRGAKKHKKKVMKNPMQAWTKVVDDSSAEEYFYNELTGESAWELPAGASLMSDAPFICEDDIDWEQEMLNEFSSPKPVPESIGLHGSSLIWPKRSVDGEPSELVRWNSFIAEDPYRQWFTRLDVNFPKKTRVGGGGGGGDDDGTARNKSNRRTSRAGSRKGGGGGVGGGCDGSDGDGSDDDNLIIGGGGSRGGEGGDDDDEEGVSRLFAVDLVFFAFVDAVPYTDFYWIESGEAPFRTRIQKKGLRFSRDISTWRKEKTKPRSLKEGGGAMSLAAEQGVHKTHKTGRGPAKESTGGGGGGGGREQSVDDGFYTFPIPMPGASIYHVNWTSGPDRYALTRGTPDWGWQQLFSFYAYAASKYHLLESASDPVCYKLVKGSYLPRLRGWKCLFAFYAFDEKIPGSNTYYVEEKKSPHQRLRIGMQPSNQWTPCVAFHAFDVPVPGSAKFDVHLTIRSVLIRTDHPDQYRIYLNDPWGCWDYQLSFYAYPATSVLLEP